MKPTRMSIHRMSHSLQIEANGTPRVIVSRER